MNVLGVIPARAGSKRVPGKNIRLLNGVPLLVYSIRAAKQSSRISRIIVSTDDPGIAEISKKAGADVPFLRPEALSQDTTPDKPVLQHALNHIKYEEGTVPDGVVILRPTTHLKRRR